MKSFDRYRLFSSLLTFHSQTIYKLFCFTHFSYQSVFYANKLTITRLGLLLCEKQLMANLRILNKESF